jgi:hypothetical protein
MMTTRTLRKLKKNSASPNQRTPNRLITFVRVSSISKGRTCMEVNNEMCKPVSWEKRGSLLTDNHDQEH